MKYSIKKYLITEKVTELKTSRVRDTRDLMFSPFESRNGREVHWLPITPKMMQRLLKRERTTAIHITDLMSVKKLKKLENTAKSISTSTRHDDASIIHTVIDTYAAGNVSTRGDGNVAAVVVVEGQPLIDVNEDIWTSVDKQGRRWTKTEDLLIQDQQLKRTVDEELRDMKSALVKKFQKLLWTDEGLDTYRLLKKPVPWEDVSLVRDTKILNKIVVEFHKRVEKILKKYIKKIEEVSTLQMSQGGYNELVLSHIKLKKVFAIPFEPVKFSAQSSVIDADGTPLDPKTLEPLDVDQAPADTQLIIDKVRAIVPVEYMSGLETLRDKLKPYIKISS